MKSAFTQACVAALVAALVPGAAAAPAPEPRAIVERAVTGPVIFLSNCFDSAGKAHGEFDYYSDAKNTVLSGKTSAPTLINVVNPSSAVDYIDGGTFVTAGTTQQFSAIISIDENDFGSAGSHVGNGKSTTWFWALECFEMNSATVYTPKAGTTCSSSIYCAQGPADPADQ